MGHGLTDMGEMPTCKWENNKIIGTSIKKISHHHSIFHVHRNLTEAYKGLIMRIFETLRTNYTRLKH